MAATVLLVTLTIALVILLGAALWAVCLMAGASRPLRRPSHPAANLSDPISPAAPLEWRPRPQASLRGSQSSRRTGALRRSVLSLWRE